MVVDIVLPAVLGSIEDQSLSGKAGSGWIRTDSDLGIAHRNLEIGRQSMTLKMMDEEHVVPGGCYDYGGS